VLLLTLFTPCCMSYHYVWINDEYTHMCYWYHYVSHVAWQICMSELMMNVLTCVTVNTTSTMLYTRSLCQMNVHTCFTDHPHPYTMLYVRSVYPFKLWMYIHMLLTALLTPCWMSDPYVWSNDEWWMYPFVLLITLLTPCGMSDQYVWFNDECTHMFYW